VFSGEGTESAIGGHLAEPGSKAVGQGGLRKGASDGEVHLDVVLGEEPQRDVGTEGRPLGKERVKGGLGKQGGGSGSVADGGESIGGKAEFAELNLGEKLRDWAGKRRRSRVDGGTVAEVGDGMDGAIGADNEVGGNVPPGFGEIHAETTLRRWKDSGDEIELSGVDGVVGGGVKERPSNIDALSARSFPKGLDVEAGKAAIGEAVGIGGGEGGADADRYALGPKDTAGIEKDEGDKEEAMAHRAPAGDEDCDCLYYSAN